MKKSKRLGAENIFMVNYGRMALAIRTRRGEEREIVGMME